MFPSEFLDAAPLGCLQRLFIVAAHHVHSGPHTRCPLAATFANFCTGVTRISVSARAELRHAERISKPKNPDREWAIVLNTKGMMIMRLLGAIAFALLAGAPAVAQEESSIIELAGPCDGRELQIARMPWTSAAILAEIHARLIRRAFGCVVRVVAGDLAATSSSMVSTEQPAVAPEMWITRVADIWNSAVGANKVRSGGPSYSGGAFEGWFIPRFVAEAWPELRSAASVAEHFDVFASEGEKGRFISCPPDWACSIINRNLMNAYGYDDMFEIVEPGNRFEFDTLIAEAASRQEPVLLYYWQPNAVLSQLDLQPLDMGAYSAAAANCLARRGCSDPEPSAFSPEAVVAALAEWVVEDAPEIASYFQRAAMPFDVMNALLAWQSEQGASVESTADHFVEAYESVWSVWASVN
jgi:glycine betaine/proline transport system substrate-binding protein